VENKRKQEKKEEEKKKKRRRKKEGNRMSIFFYCFLAKIDIHTPINCCPSTPISNKPNFINLLTTFLHPPNNSHFNQPINHLPNQTQPTTQPTFDFHPQVCFAISK
jgi:hypothetical protein